jgi:FkbM family methyltransferase
MKSIIKFILSKVGYRLVTKDYYENLVNINFVSNLDFHHFLKKNFSGKENICCFDIGANIGQTAKKLITYFPNSIIYAFEPVKQTFKELEKNTSLYPNIRPYNVAMGGSLGEVEIFHRENSEWNSLVGTLNEYAKSHGASSEKAKIETIDNFVIKNKITKINFCKSDTEGFEMEVLKGAKYCLETQVIDNIYVEVGFSKNDFQHTYFTIIMEYLENYGYGLAGLFERSFKEDNVLHYANALFCKIEKK